mmetsp:Transcript_15209/g.17225  ORF Transcript_15209/g.17225 Transcript_15209/m.17225 type:complete len:168 (+) Transcript_15209:358-861(+)|eukprot:CAMPEP_0184032358 /NCGR_PEP_ID=MMETSP0955-20130417/2957_1 /TAXON_ID=627963 /ORGANISM="Aplanochytrium sp, Strain PBS07" /LENGTH=167 /DNA_ID=CAMNT_0026318385 /DNA_START=448 /DNA_END=951 /DNA_ORIENTATION=+
MIKKFTESIRLGKKEESLDCNGRNMGRQRMTDLKSVRLSGEPLSSDDVISLPRWRDELNKSAVSLTTPLAKGSERKAIKRRRRKTNKQDSLSDDETIKPPPRNYLEIKQEKAGKIVEIPGWFYESKDKDKSAGFWKKTLRKGLKKTKSVRIRTQSFRKPTPRPYESL